MRQVDRKPGVKLVTDPAPSSVRELSDETLKLNLKVYGVDPDALSEDQWHELVRLVEERDHRLFMLNTETRPPR